MRHGRVTLLTLTAVAALISPNRLQPSATAAQNTRGGLIITLQLLTGTSVRGVAIWFDDTVVGLMLDGWPAAVGWDVVLPDSACRTAYMLYADRRGGHANLTAMDHFALAKLAMRQGRPAIANRRFADAQRLDPSLAAKIKLTRTRLREASTWSVAAFGLPAAPPTDASSDEHEDASKQRSEEIIAGYKEVGRRIRDQIGSDLVLLETPHFLIWTDWAKAEHGALRALCEASYRTVASRFHLPTTAEVFAGKCPVFCMRSKQRFRQMATLLEDHVAGNAVGYTSCTDNGHIHVVLRRQGGSAAGRNAFATNLVHETTHAFMHRFASSRQLPAWLNEGFAEFVAEDVLQDRCPNAETAAVVADALVAGNYEIAMVFSADGQLDARFYPLANSLVSFLIDRDADAFGRLIVEIKAGKPVAEAMANTFGWTLKELTEAWRQEHSAGKRN